MDITRFESAETASQTKSDSALREELLKKLIDRELLGATRQILVDTVIDQLPLRELPPGNTSSLYIMYLAYMRTAGNDATPCTKSTFYSVANIWKKCLKFRRKSDHAMCLECSRLKSAINRANDLHLKLICWGVVTFCVFLGVGLLVFPLISSILLI